MSLITYAEWHAQTSHFWNTSAFKNLDKAFKKWEKQGKTQQFLNNLAQSFSTWQISKIAKKLDSPLKQQLAAKSSKTQYILPNYNYISDRNKIKKGQTQGPMERLSVLIATSSGSNAAVALQATGSMKLVFDPVKRSQINHAGFSKPVVARIEEAIRRLKMGIKLVMEDLPQARTVGTPARARYEDWFGVFDEARYRIVKKNFLILLDVVQQSNFQFDEDTGPGNAYYAATLPRHRTGADDIQIDLGTAFFVGGRRYDRTTSATVGTLVHELTHGCFYTYDMYLSPARDAYRDDENEPNGGWGGWHLCNDPGNDKDLATRFPEGTLENADNYGEYAAAVVQVSQL